MSTNINPFSASGFGITLQRSPQIPFSAQRISIPSITGNPPNQPTYFKTLPQTYDTITVGQLSVDFILDEKLTAYREMQDWMRGIGFPDDHEQYKKLRDSEFGLKSDLTIHVLNSKKIETMTIQFINVFPTDLGEVSLSATDSQTMFPICSVTFTYDNYYFNMKE